MQQNITFIIPDEGGEMWLAGQAEVDCDVSNPHWSIKEWDLWQDHFVGTDGFLTYLWGPILLFVPSRTLHYDQEVTAISIIKDLAEKVRQTDTVVQWVSRIIDVHINAWKRIINVMNKGGMSGDQAIFSINASMGSTKEL